MNEMRSNDDAPRTNACLKKNLVHLLAAGNVVTLAPGSAANATTEPASGKASCFGTGALLFSVLNHVPEKVRVY